MFNKALKTAKDVAVAAGQAIMEIYSSHADFDIEYKADHSPLTLADQESNRIIVKALADCFPQYALLSEEEQDNRERLHNDYCFVIDPLDGTKEFIKRNGQFTVNIALAYQHRAVMGVIYVPVTGELYYAQKGKGAWLEEAGGRCRSLHVSRIKERDRLRAVMSSSHGSPEMDALIERYQLTNFVKMGSSLKGCVVARGDAEIYYRYNPTMEWDTAAMQCIVEEAGGIFRQMDDSEMLYNRENSLNEKGFYIINCVENRL